MKKAPLPLQRQAWTPLDMKEDIVRKLPGSPDDFREVQTTFRKSSRRLTIKSSSAL
ncbi:hypothetical protein Bca4012_064549 [Brassica carinata]